MKTYIRIYSFNSNVGNFFAESVNSYQMLEEYFLNFFCYSQYNDYRYNMLLIKLRALIVSVHYMEITIKSIAQF